MKKSSARTRSKSSRWSAEITKRSDALDLESDVFKGKNPHLIALSLKRSAERSKRRKGTLYQSAMSMLNFYINRAGKNLPQNQKRVLERAKTNSVKRSGALRWNDRRGTSSTRWQDSCEFCLLIFTLLALLRMKLRRSKLASDRDPRERGSPKDDARTDRSLGTRRFMNVVVTGSPRHSFFTLERRPKGPWLQRLQFQLICSDHL